jgi:CRP/FNR family transcriptional regulator, cyclic AMP receptor protein
MAISLRWMFEDLLAGVPLFAGLSRRDLARLVKAGHDMTYTAGTALTSDDESGISFFVIAEGEARVEVKGKEVRRLGAGDYFGEMALIDRSHSSATVTAVTEMRCFVMAQWHFRPFATEHPDVAWALLEAMVKRVREAESRTSTDD